jgi:hypothetical protein
MFSTRSVRQLRDAPIEELLEAVFSTRSVRQLRDAPIEKLLEAVFSVLYMQWCFKEDKSRVRVVVRQLPTNREVNMEVEGSTALVAVARRKPVKIQ